MFPNSLRCGWRVVTLLLLLGQTCLAADLQLYTEENPPLNLSRGGQVSGFSTDIINALSARTGDSITIELGPWTRGYTKAQNEANTGVFSTARIAAREKRFQWVGPLTHTRNRFYTHKAAGKRITSLDEAARAGRLVLPRQWYSYEYLQAQGMDNIYTVTTPEKMMQMFSAGRADVLAVSDIALPGLLAMVGMTEAQVEPQFIFLEHQSYLAFSLKTDAQIVRRWQRALDASKRDGTFASLFQRWFPGETMPRELLQTAGPD